MPVSTVAYEASTQRVASAGRDCTTRVWDLEAQKSLMKRKIPRNVATQVRWLPNEPNVFLETSEDLYIRAFDTRVKPFKPVVEFKVDTNFATTCDLWSEGTQDKYMVTGHRGFNGEGADVKLWDLRRVLDVQTSDTVTSSDLTHFEYTGH